MAEPIQYVTLPLDEAIKMVKEAVSEAMADFRQSQKPQPQGLYTREEAAMALRFFKKDHVTPNPRAIDNQIKLGNLKAVTVGRIVRIEASSIQEFIKKARL